ncbi:hypothetical protein AALB16_14035 [Lachnospiraceae bacterium 62-35]
MREEASIKEWGRLYEVATRIKEKKPWEQFWDMDLIAIRKNPADDNDIVFISIMGKGGECYGISVYEGYRGLNDYIMLATGEQMNLTTEYILYSQHCLTCYWGNGDELSEEQKEIIKELGYKYQGKNQWLYFMSFLPGYYPFNFNRSEVERMIGYLENLEKALIYYEESKINVDFSKGNFYLFGWNEEEKKWEGREQQLPFTSYQLGSLMINNEEVIKNLKKVPKNQQILQADIIYMGVSVNGEKGDRPENPRLCLIGEKDSRAILRSDMAGVEEEACMILAETMVNLIFESGAPEEIQVSNVITESVLKPLCEICGICLKRVKKLTAIDDFQEKMGGVS